MGKTVRANVAGFVGGEHRPAGSKFEWPEGNKLGSWVTVLKSSTAAPEPVQDDDGDNGGNDNTDPVVVPADWRSLNAAGKRDLAHKLTGERAPNATVAETLIEEYLEANKPEAFGDAPPPGEAASETPAQALGEVQPDWVPPDQLAQVEE